MRKAKVPLTNFQFGEISPSLISRTDTRVYNNSAQKIENFFLRNIPLCGVLGGGYNKSFDKLIDLHSMLHKNCAKYF